MKYLLGGRRYEHLPNNEFKDCVTKEVIKTSNIKHEKLMQRVAVGFTSDLPKKYHMNMYKAMRRLRGKRCAIILNPIKAKPQGYKVFKNTICFDGRTWIKIPNGKTVEEIIKKYNDKIYGT